VHAQVVAGATPGDADLRRVRSERPLTCVTFLLVDRLRPRLGRVERLLGQSLGLLERVNRLAVDERRPEGGRDRGGQVVLDLLGRRVRVDRDPIFSGAAFASIATWMPSAETSNRSNT